MAELALSETRSFFKKTKIFLSSQYQQYSRVWKILRKPTMQEFKMVSIVSIIGLLIIGALGFVISVAINLMI
ncbi:MAG: protein translocase SEC61 complex subunit gamma [Nanoarchaeota archaeon]|nr:protein translocase SEC61 complex subunit gamma [Nanoarchaeota archaeon]